MQSNVSERSYLKLLEVIQQSLIVPINSVAKACELKFYWWSEIAKFWKPEMLFRQVWQGKEQKWNYRGKQTNKKPALTKSTNRNLGTRE